MRKLFLVLASVSLITACSKEGAKEEIKEILECSMSAKLVGQVDQIDRISNHANPIAIKAGFSRDEYMKDVARMHADIMTKWNLKSMSRDQQNELLVSIYNSSRCAALHDGPEISVEDVPPDA